MAAMSEGAEIGTYDLTPMELEELAGCGALVGLATLDGEWEKIATIVKTVYIAGVRRGMTRERESRDIPGGEE